MRPGTDRARTASSSALLDRIRVALDILALYLVLKFTKKPLRFFGMLGLPICSRSAWSAASPWRSPGCSTACRSPTARRWSWRFCWWCSGIQVIALGLIGELVIFASGRRIKEHVIERIVGGEEPERRR